MSDVRPVQVEGGSVDVVQDFRVLTSQEMGISLVR